jgi:hypothetical protein
VVHLAGIDQLITFLSADVETIKPVALQREAGDRQCLALGTRDLDPIIRPAKGIIAVPNFRHDALKPGLTGVLEHLRAIDLKALAELNMGLVDQLLQ